MAMKLPDWDGLRGVMTRSAATGGVGRVLNPGEDELRVIPASPDASLSVIFGNPRLLGREMSSGGML
eukprot:CAMPEP_0197854930 /NCGR_PEP_ID=MMETSP1438-20131217/25601_1 /TAXON_ID=1461541 /ORGANISM="Pterosperma sp., Strain CCMP1384" /LENGTH=66 /DNA_ID=CAMNT_0043469849 /DNA_START=129 /DNA_END=329 /DNA_ORIENTATION=+